MMTISASPIPNSGESPNTTATATAISTTKRYRGSRKPAPPQPKTYSLVVLINDTGYRVHSVHSNDPTSALKSFELRKSDGTAYHISQFGYGCECTCPDFIYRRDGLDPTGCKHIKALCACQMLDNANRDFTPRTIGRANRV